MIKESLLSALALALMAAAPSNAAGFQITSPAFPAGQGIPKRFTCDGEFSSDPPLRKNIKYYCIDPKTGAKTQVNSIKVVAISAVVYSALLFLPIWWLDATARWRRQRR